MRLEFYTLVIYLGVAYSSCMAFLPQPTCAPYPAQCCPTTTQVPGPQGPAGTATDGINGISSFTFSTESFVMPASGSNVTFAVANSDMFSIGSYVWVEVAGEMQVVSKPDAASIQLKNTGWAGNAAAAAVIPTSVQISPTGKSAGTP